MKIGIACDHRGYELKEYLKKEIKDVEIVDYGTFSTEIVDYPDYAFKLGQAVSEKTVDFGIAICGSGIGISIACNKVRKIRCAKVENEEEAKVTRNDNDANIVALSANTNKEIAVNIVKTFIFTPFSNEDRHLKRIKKIELYEDNNYEC